MKLGLLPRLIAAVWFALAACVPVGVFLLVFGRIGLGLRGWTLAGVPISIAIVPISAASVLGFTIGAAILETSQFRSPAQSSLRGLAVAVLSYLALFLSILGTAVLASNTEQRAAVFFWVVVVFFFGNLYFGWLIVLCGLLAGLLLYRLSLRENFNSRLASVP